MQHASRSGVIVLGMHRSGTSAFTGALQHIGLRLPLDEFLMPADENNPRGYFENGPLVAVNDCLLRELGGEWSAPPLMLDGGQDEAKLEPSREPSAIVFRSTMPTANWLWKDPRLCLLLPFWTSLLERPLAVVLVYRDPLEVARSLAKRNGFSIHLGLALWERYMRDALRNVRGQPVVTAAFDAFLKDPVGWAHSIRDILDDLGLAVGDVNTGGVRQLISPSLPSAGNGVTDTRTLSPEQQQLLELLDSMDQRYPSFPAVSLPPPTPWGEALLEERRAMLGDHRRALAAREWLRRDRSRLQTSLERSQAARQRLVNERDELRTSLERSQAARQRLVNERDELLMNYQEEIASWPRWLRTVREVCQGLRKKNPSG